MKKISQKFIPAQKQAQQKFSPPEIITSNIYIIQIGFIINDATRLFSEFVFAKNKTSLEMCNLLTAW
jgi:hypothetical protein